MDANLDLLLTVVYCMTDDFLPKRAGNARRRITDAEIITLCLAQAIMGLPSDERFLAVARHRLAHLFPYLPAREAFHKRRLRVSGQIEALIAQFARHSPGFFDDLLLVDSTPVECARSRETVKRGGSSSLDDALSNAADYGYCASHSRYFWGFRLYLLCASDGMPIAFELAPANAPEREVAAEMLARVQLDGYTVIADKGFAAEEFEQLMSELGAIFLRPDRKDERPRFGRLGGVRQWIESIIDSIKGQLSLERHGAHTMPGLITRITQRLLTLAAGLWHNWNLGNPGRHLTDYDH
jgi:hypothetical protein